MVGWVKFCQPALSQRGYQWALLANFTRCGSVQSLKNMFVIKKSLRFRRDFCVYGVVCVDVAVAVAVAVAVPVGCEPVADGVIVPPPTTTMT